MEIGHTKFLLDLAAKVPAYTNKDDKETADSSSAATAAHGTIFCLVGLQPKVIVRADQWGGEEKITYLRRRNVIYIVSED